MSSGSSPEIYHEMENRDLGMIKGSIVPGHSRAKRWALGTVADRINGMETEDIKKYHSHIQDRLRSEQNPETKKHLEEINMRLKNRIGEERGREYRESQGLGEYKRAALEKLMK